MATGDVDCVAALLNSKKAAANVGNYRGETPLHLAAREGNLEVCSSLFLKHLMLAHDIVLHCNLLYCTL